MDPRLSALPCELITLVADNLRTKDLCNFAATSRRNWAIVKDDCHNEALLLACPTYNDYEKSKYIRRRWEPVVMKRMNAFWKCQSLLIEAVSHDYLSAVRSLLDHGINPNSHNIHGRRLFHFAIILFKMPKRAVDPRYYHSARRPPCLRPNKSGAYEMIKLLLSYGADPNLSGIDEPDSTPLSLAAELGMSEVACLLMDSGANVSQRGVLGKICAYCDMKTLQCALDLGVNIDTLDSEGVSLLYYAAKNEDPQIIKYLLRAGLADQVNETKRGRTPLLKAITAKRPDNVIVLVEHGAEVNILHPSTSKSASSTACARSANALIHAGADPNWEDRVGRRALHIAVIYDDMEKVRTILQSNKPFDIAARDKFGRTALHLATNAYCYNDFKREFIIMLLAAGAPVEAQDNNACTPIDYAFKEKQFEYVYWILTGDLDFCEEDSTFDKNEKAKWLADGQAEYEELKTQKRSS